MVGCGLNTIKTGNASKAALQEYSMNITRLVRSIDRLHELNSKVLWVLQQPVNEDKLPPDYNVVTNEQIDLYNKAALDVSAYNTVALVITFALL